MYTSSLIKYLVFFCPWQNKCGVVPLGTFQSVGGHFKIVAFLKEFRGAKKSNATRANDDDDDDEIDDFDAEEIIENYLASSSHRDRHDAFHVNVDNNETGNVLIPKNKKPEAAFKIDVNPLAAPSIHFDSEEARLLGGENVRLSPELDEEYVEDFESRTFGPRDSACKTKDKSKVKSSAKRSATTTTSLPITPVIVGVDEVEEEEEDKLEEEEDEVIRATPPGRKRSRFSFRESSRSSTS